MKNLENRVAYLTTQGARQMFGSGTEAETKCVGLAVVPTTPTKSDNSDYIVYGDTFVDGNGEYIGGCIGQDALTDEVPSVEQQATAFDAYLAHCEMMDATYGYECRKVGDLEKIKAMPQTAVIPGLYEYPREWHLERRASVPLIEPNEPEPVIVLIN